MFKKIKKLMWLRYQVKVTTLIKKLTDASMGYTPAGVIHDNRLIADWKTHFNNNVSAFKNK